MELGDVVTVQRAVAGEPDALVTLLQRYHGRVLAFIERQLPQALQTQLEPGDVLQDTYFKAFRLIGTLRADDVETFVRWLLSIARNQIVDALRRHSAAKRGRLAAIGGQFDVEDESLVLTVQELGIYERTPSKSAIARELMDTVAQSISRLPEAYRDALRFRYIDGISPREIAAKMGRTERAVHELCHRALKSLRLELRSASHYL
jgi:RNA polymerase sigma-70 factor (subfamily 1)